MRSILQAEIHDAKMKLVKAINEQDQELIDKYEQVIKDLEKSLKALS